MTTITTPFFYKIVALTISPSTQNFKFDKKDTKKVSRFFLFIKVKNKVCEPLESNRPYSRTRTEPNLEIVCQTLEPMSPSLGSIHPKVQADCWWPKTSGCPKMPGKVSQPRRQCLDHFISQEHTLFKDLRRQDIEIKKDKTKKEWDLSNGFFKKRKLNDQWIQPQGEFF